MPKYLEMACVLLDHTFFGYNTYELKCLPPTPLPSKMKTCHRQLLPPPTPKPQMKLVIDNLLYITSGQVAPSPTKIVNVDLDFRFQLDCLLLPQTPSKILQTLTIFLNTHEIVHHRHFFYYCSHKYTLHSVYIRNIYYTLTEK